MALLEAHTEGYWQTHYTFGAAHDTPSEKHLQRSSLQLLLINTVAPLLFCYGKYHNEEALCERAIDLLDALKADIHTMFDVLSVLIRHGVFSNAEEQFHHPRLGRSRVESPKRRPKSGAHPTQAQLLRPQRLPALSLWQVLPEEQSVDKLTRYK